jgi:carbamoyl-phosphate synthase small subunit
MRSVEDIIVLLGGSEAAAERCGVGTEAIRKWRQSKAIPAKHWPAILTATGLTLADMPGAPSDTPKTEPLPMADTAPPGATACLVLADGSVFWGRGFGAEGKAVAEICFNTGMTGYQETLTDPSYAGQIITFTFPHIGNVGTNQEDIEALTPAARGLIVKQDVTEPANYRATRHLHAWLVSHGVPGLAGIDTRALTARIRDGGPPNGVLWGSLISRPFAPKPPAGRGWKAWIWRRM